MATETREPDETPLDVSRSQVKAAQMIVRRSRERGQEPPAEIVAIARARPRSTERASA